MLKLCGMGVPPWRAIAVASLGALVFFVVGARAATDASVGCGDTITQDTRLDHDLIDCPGDGLVIGADGITLDLGGHAISGAGFGDGVDGSGHANVTVEHGEIRDFGAGVFAEQAPGIRVRRLEVSGSRYSGIALFYPSGVSRIERNRVSGSAGAGILVSDAGSAGEVLVAENVAVGNCVGIRLFDVRGARVEENTVLRSGETCRDLAGASAGDGISSLDGKNLIEGNVARGNLGDGIDVAGFPELSFLQEDVVAENRADRNGDLGIEAGPAVVDGGGNRAHRNGNPLQCVNVACT